MLGCSMFYWLVYRRFIVFLYFAVKLRLKIDTELMRKIFLRATVDWCLHITAGQLPPQVQGYTICLKPNRPELPVSAFGL